MGKAIPPTRAGSLRACLYGEGPALLIGLGSLPRSRVSVKFFVKIYFCLYERMASPPWRDKVLYTRQSFVCLCVGYKMKLVHKYRILGFVGK